MTTPTDPLYGNQWYFAEMGDIEAIWGEYTGAGIKVGIYDDGVDDTHPDLAPNYDPTLHVVYQGAPVDGAPSTGGHGTKMAGLVAAAMDGEGGVGVAYGATISSVGVIDPSSVVVAHPDNPADNDGFYAALAHMTVFDVVNNSWGYYPIYYDFLNPNLPGWGRETLALWEAASDAGRGGLGTIILQANGNDNINSNGESLAASRFSISVAALQEGGQPTMNSSYGSNVLVAAGGANLPTTIIGGGYGDTSGSSGASAIVSGVVALMLEANPNLGWRDVQNILASSATHTGSAFGADLPGTYEDATWTINGADDWNGGGRHFHTNYGYGQVNAYNAVRMAEAWALFSPDSQTSANEGATSITTPPDFDPVALDGLGPVTISAAMPQDLIVEHVSVTLTLTHSYFSDLDIVLIAPDGSRHMLADRSYDVAAGASNDGLTWTFGADSLRGMSTQGEWVVEIADRNDDADTGMLYSAEFEFFGRAESVADVHHFTDEFELMAALQPGRRMISDTNGGEDWLDLAAIAGDLVVDLNGGAQSTLDGADLFTIASGTAIENVVTGDGDDLIRGNGSDNELHGMRGDDTLTGGGGNDTLDGGIGADVAIYDGRWSDYLIDQHDDGSVTVADRRGGAPDGTDTLASVELAEFASSVYTMAEILNQTPTLVGSIAGQIISEGVAFFLDVFALFTDADGSRGDELSFALSSAPSWLTVGKQTGELSGTPGFDDAGQTTVTVTASDIYGAEASAKFALTVGDVNQEPSMISLSSASVAENSAAGTVIGKLSATDPDEADAPVLTLVDDAQGRFVIVGNELRVAMHAVIDFERDASHQIVVRATDAKGLSVDEGFIISVADIAPERVVGSEGSDRIVGGREGDRLLGKGGADHIEGGVGADWLAGGMGGDVMKGGRGNDTYYADNRHDLIDERGGDGVDTVHSSISFNLSPSAQVRGYVEKLVLTGSARNAIGNGLANGLTGNGRDNTLDGGKGADTLVGGQGDDRLIGGKGADILFGGKGADTFLFKDTTESTKDAWGRDLIRDFQPGQGDKINLFLIDANPQKAGNQKFSFLGHVDAFNGKAGELRYETKASATYLYGDTNGDGKADLSIVFDDNIALKAADFIL